MFKFRLDWWLVIPSVLLLILGLTVLRSVAPEQVIYQLSFSVFAMFTFLFFAFTDHRIFFSLHIPIYIMSLIFLVTPFIFGSHSHGAIRWIQLGQVSIQPSEIIKPFLLITFATLAFHKKIKYLILSFLPVIVIFLQPDLGTTLVLIVGWLIMLISQIPPRMIVILLLIVGLILPVGWLVLKDYQKDRLITFINPYNDPLGKGYHVIQSTIAVGSGGLIGRGLGHGTQSQLKFLPEHHTDFIFASLSEELGFIGSFTTIILFSILLWRMFYISRQTSDQESSLFCLSVTSMLTFQVFINIGMNMGIAPITGITLPFLSYGGSSLLSLAILTGLVNSVSTSNFNNSLFQIH